MSVQWISGAAFQEIKVKGKVFNALIDTGATNMSLLGQECEELGLAPEGGRNVTCIHGDKKEVAMFGGEVEISNKILRTSIMALTRPIKIPGSVISAILGRDVLNKFKVTLDGPNLMGEFLA